MLLMPWVIIAPAAGDPFTATLQLYTHNLLKCVKSSFELKVMIGSRTIALVMLTNNNSADGYPPIKVHIS